MKLVSGNRFSDERGVILYNNDFDFSEVKRMYVIQNHSDLKFRGWQGHKIEKRWYTCVHGMFRISIAKIDDWSNPSKNLKIIEVILSSYTGLDFLYIEPDHITLIESLESESKLVVYSNYKFGEINDEYRFPVEYFR